LHQKYLGHDSIETLSSRVSLADRNMEKFTETMREPEESVGGLKINLQSTLTPIRMPETPREFALGNLYRAKNHYLEAISLLADNQAVLHPQLVELEYKFLETLFLLGYQRALLADPHYYLSEARRFANKPNRWTYLRRNDDGYLTGRETFESILATMEGDPDQSAEQHISAMMEFGDWHLLFGRDDAAMGVYQQAYDLARQLALGPEAVTDLFRPAVPIHLPLITAKPNSREKFDIGPEVELSYDGYIDISFYLNENGTAKGLRVLGKSAGTTWEVEKRLRRYLRNSPFRPRIVDGAPLGRDDLTLRYYYSFLERPGDR